MVLQLRLRRLLLVSPCTAARRGAVIRCRRIRAVRAAPTAAAARVAVEHLQVPAAAAIEAHPVRVAERLLLELDLRCEGARAGGDRRTEPGLA